MNKSLETDEMRLGISKLTDKLNHNIKDFHDVLELETSILEQKIYKMATSCDTRVDELISLVEELAKTQNKFFKNEK